eukprot:1077143-Amphidinium_carterae.1
MAIISVTIVLGRVIVVILLDFWPRLFGKQQAPPGIGKVRKDLLAKSSQVHLLRKPSNSKAYDIETLESGVSKVNAVVV